MDNLSENSIVKEPFRSRKPSMLKVVATFLSFGKMMFD